MAAALPRWPLRLTGLFGPGQPPDEDLPAMLRQLRRDAALHPSDAASLTASLACSFLDRRLFQDWEVRGGSPREAADRYGEQDLALLLALREFGALPYFVLGDSHSRLYQHPGLGFGKDWLLPISVTCSGGSARGLGNPTSNLRYGERLRRFLERVEPALAAGVACFFKFGQVDLEYLLPFRAVQAGAGRITEAEAWGYAEETLDRYLAFLETTIPAPRRPRTFVCSVCLPAVADELWREVCAEGLLAFMKATPEQAAALREGFAAVAVPDLGQRSRLHRRFNARLKAAAEERGFGFVDDAGPFWDESRQTLDPRHATRGAGRDVHMDRSPETLAVIAALIRERAEPGRLNGS